jgi:hypothetical protein
LMWTKSGERQPRSMYWPSATHIPLTYQPRRADGDRGLARNAGRAIGPRPAVGPRRPRIPRVPGGPCRARLASRSDAPSRPRVPSRPRLPCLPVGSCHANNARLTANAGQALWTEGVNIFVGQNSSSSSPSPPSLPLLLLPRRHIRPAPRRGRRQRRDAVDKRRRGGRRAGRSRDHHKPVVGAPGGHAGQHFVGQQRVKQDAASAAARVDEVEQAVGWGDGEDEFAGLREGGGGREECGGVGERLRWLETPHTALSPHPNTFPFSPCLP